MSVFENAAWSLEASYGAEGYNAACCEPNRRAIALPPVTGPPGVCREVEAAPFALCLIRTPARAAVKRALSASSWATGPLPISSSYAREVLLQCTKIFTEVLVRALIRAVGDGKLILSQLSSVRSVVSEASERLSV